MQDKVTIKIARELYQGLSEMIPENGLYSVTEFIVFAVSNLAGGKEVVGKGKMME